MSGLILASASLRRLDLLKQINIIPDKIIAPQIEETKLKNEKPKNYNIRIAKSKAEKILQENKGFFILACDTIVVKNNQILDKASCDEDVVSYLKILSGAAHRVYSCVVLADPAGKISYHCVESRVKFKNLNQEEIKNYLLSKEGIGKAGGYAIQGLAGCFVKNIIGSYSSVVGLPLYETNLLLKGAGFKNAKM